MKGQILDFSIQKCAGAISGEDGNRYLFHASQWQEQILPTKGMVVDFDVNEKRHAIAVYSVVQQPMSFTKTNSIKTFRSTAQPVLKGEMSLFEYAISVVKDNYVNFEGRARRKEYWGFCLFSSLVTFALIILSVIGAAISDEMAIIFSIPYYLFVLAIMLPNIAVGVRRLHDIDKSGWWLLLGLIPLVGTIWLVVLFATDGNSGENQFGEDPKAIGY